MELSGGIILSRWSCFFDGMQFSSQDFYEKVVKALRPRNIPRIKYLSLVFPEGGMFSGRRKYLRVQRGDFYFDICAAPFGDGFFVSWWFVQSPPGCLSWLIAIPLIGGLFKRRMTYYRMDTENMFKECFQLCFLEAIDDLTAMKGSRTLTPEERKYIDS